MIAVPASRRQHAVERAAHDASAATEHVRVDLGRAHVGVPKLLLHRANVSATLEQMRRERVAQRVAARGFRYASAAHGSFHRALNHRLVEMMATPNSRAWIDAGTVGDEDPLPTPFRRSVRILAGERMREIDRADARLTITLEQCTTRREVSLQGIDQLIWQC